jgi:hypothetical protein
MIRRRRKRREEEAEDDIRHGAQGAAVDASSATGAWRHVAPNSQNGGLRNDGLRNGGQCADGQQKEKRYRLRSLKLVAALVGILVAVLFILLDDMRLPMVWVNRWTPLIATVFLVHLVLLIVQVVVKKRPNKDDDDDENEYQPNMRNPASASGPTV